jgi:hypothetical protein
MGARIALVEPEHRFDESRPRRRKLRMRENFLWRTIGSRKRLAGIGHRFLRCRTLEQDTIKRTYHGAQNSRIARKMFCRRGHECARLRLSRHADGCDCHRGHGGVGNGYPDFQPRVPARVFVVALAFGAGLSGEAHAQSAASTARTRPPRRLRPACHNHHRNNRSRRAAANGKAAALSSNFGSFLTGTDAHFLRVSGWRRAFPTWNNSRKL